MSPPPFIFYSINYLLFDFSPFSFFLALHNNFICIWELIFEAGTSWTARSSDFDQQLIIDLGNVKNVTRIAIQGRPHSTEYVTEFSISYGSNGLDYTDYKEAGGNTKVRERGVQDITS